MLMTTSDSVPGREIAETLGLMQGAAEILVYGTAVKLR